MNHELKQRLIGAVVVTALAAIFIPMLFDDPIDNSGQVVSELAIPATPPALVDTTANKLPANAAQVLKPTATNPDDPAATEDDADATADAQAQTPPLQPNTEDLVDVDEEQVLADTKKPLSEAKNANAGAGDVIDDVPANPQEAGDLDTGDVEEAKVHSKNPKAGAVRQAVTAKSSGISPEIKKAAENPETSVKRPKPTPLKQTASKTIEPQTEEKKSKPVAPKATAGFAHAPEADVAAKANTTTAKPKTATGKPELQRWYISAGSFSQRENALTLYDNLHNQGLAVVMDTIKVAEKGELYRLKIGPELDKKRANAIREKLDKQNIKTFLIAE